MPGILHDIRDAVRALRHAPAFTTIVSLTLALGIGVNTAIFSLVQAALFRPLPYRDADRLVRVAEWPKTGGNYTVAPAAFVAFRAQSRAFAGLETSIGTSMTWLSSAEPVAVRAQLVTAGYFDLLGVGAERGRTFAPAEEASDNSCRAVVSHQFWTSQLSADARVLGRVLQLDSRACPVIGVLAAEAIFNRTASDVYLVYRLSADASQQQGRILSAIGRLAPGVSFEQASAELASVAETFNATRGSAGRGWTTQLTPLRDVLVRSDTRRLAWVLTATVGCVLLVACVNVAGLSLSRTLDRRREVAVRAALGATRLRLFRGLIVEGLLLSAVGGLLAIIVGSWTLRLFAAILPAGLLPAAGASLDANVLAFTAVLSIATGLAFGTVPAWQSSRTSAVDSMAAGGRTLSASRLMQRARGALVVAEIALATLLVIGASWLVVSFARLTRVDPGISAARVLTLRLTLPASTYPTEPAIAAGFDRILEHVRAVPGVAHASVVTSLPLGGWLFGSVFTVEGTAASDTPTSAHIQSIASDYFVTLGIPLVSGREFTTAETATSARVAIVNQTFAARYIPDGPAIGRRLRMDNQLWQIVGVNRDVKTGGLADAPLATPEIYVPHQQSPAGAMYLAIRATRDDPAALAPAIRRAVQDADANLAVGRVIPMDDRISGSVDTPRFRAAMIGAFAVLAAILASLGVYAVRAQGVAGRRREIGIRVALGATRARVFRLVMLQGLTQVALGLAIGGVAARLLGRQVQPWLFATQTTDPALIAFSLAVLALAALLASWGPAHRAASVHPLTTLRE